jgi:hypothetical protein
MPYRPEIDVEEERMYSLPYPLPADKAQVAEELKERKDKDYVPAHDESDENTISSSYQTSFSRNSYDPL